MQIMFIEVLAAAISTVAAAGLIRTWRRLTKVDKKASVAVTRQDTHKTVVLPQEYSPTAVKALTELVA